MSLVDNLKKQLTKDEGKRKYVYKDHLGFWTIAIGRLVDDRKGVGLRESEMQFMFQNDVDERMQELSRRIPWINKLDEPRQGVLLNMSFQLGVEGLLGFVTTLRLVKEGKYKEASEQMMKSKWARQTPERARRLADQMEVGQWVFDE